MAGVLSSLAGKPAVLLTVVTGAIVGGLAATGVLTPDAPEPEVTPPAQIASLPAAGEVSDPVVAVAEPEPEPEQVDVSGPKPPAFDLVRIEADGSSLIAGEAEPGADVILSLDGVELERVTADGTGKFAAFLTIDPSQSTRVLTLDAVVEGKIVPSEDQVIVAAAPVAVAEVAPELVAEVEPAAEVAPEAGDKAKVDAKPDVVAQAQPEPSAIVEPSAETAGVQVEPEAPAVAKDEDPAKQAVADADRQLEGETGAVADAEPEPAQVSAEVAEVAEDPAGDVDTEAPTQIAEGGSTPEGAETPRTAAIVEPAPTPEAVEEPVEVASADVAKSVEPVVSSSSGVAQAVAEDAQSVDVAAADDTPQAVTDQPVETPQVAKTTTPEPVTDAPETPTVAAVAALKTPAGESVAVAPDVPQPSTSSAAPSQPDAPAQASGAADVPQAPTVFLASRDGVKVLQSPRAPERGPAVPSSLALDSISYSDAGDVALAGRGVEGGFVRIYLDNAAVTTSRITEDGSWAVDLPEVDTGVYTLRVDSVAEDGSVTSRVETPFKRESEDVLAAAAERVRVADEPLTAVTVQPGSTLWAIAETRYGDGVEYVRVFEANRDQIRNPDLIYPGQVFAIPE